MDEIASKTTDSHIATHTSTGKFAPGHPWRVQPGDTRLSDAKREKKHRLIQAAAQDAVQRGDLKQRFGGWAWLAEVTQVQMQIATTPEAGKSAVMAAGWLVKHAGLDEPTRAEISGGGSSLAVAAVVASDALLRLWRDVAQARGEVVDA